MNSLSKRVSCSLILASIFLSGTQVCAESLKTDTQKESYSIGASTGMHIGNQIFRQSQLGIKSDIDSIVDGFVDALQNKLKIKEEDIVDNLNKRADALNKAQDALLTKIKTENKKKEDDFFAKNKKKKGVKTTKSGLQYEVTVQGKGAKTKPESIVEVTYKTYMIDGTVVEENLDKEKLTQLSMVNIVDGLKEGLALMNEGSKYKFYIPSKLAYGEEATEMFDPYTTLIFEVDLHKILKPGDLKPKEKFEIMMDEKNKEGKSHLKE